ncbi:MAG: lamin tail domain-containing protein [Bacteroidales bacterium]|nr:lamin tail domain-containing protein [Bacteroidales bacterium]
MKLFVANLFMFAAYCTIQAQGSYVTGDFHQHTQYTDGSYTFGYMMEKNNKFGLDWWANSEHGGAFNRWAKISGKDLGTNVTWNNANVELKGKENNGKMWRWQSLSEWSFNDIRLYRRILPEKLIIQGYEMNVPGHEHASVAIIGEQFNVTQPNVTALAQFEYLFDANDTDDSQPLGITNTKNTENNHGKAVEALTWLQQHYPTQSWVIPAHPERYRYTGSTGWNIEHLRDLNNVAPDVFFGFESIPGHQSAGNRGEYGDETKRPPHGSYGLCTYGGAGWMSAKVGGLWDALLSEGRNFWLFANSDCHKTGGDFFPGEYQKNYTYVSEKNNPQAIVDGLRSGNTYVVMGDLIDSLTFRISDATMGSTLTTEDDEIEIYIKIHDPQGENHNTYGGGKTPSLDHIDLIAGVVTGKVPAPATIPADGVAGYSDEYKKDSISTTRVIARFGNSASAADPEGVATTAWNDLGNGWKEIRYTVTATQNIYFRLRGTNLALNTPNQTDDCGNPLPDSLEGTNNAEKAFADLWFYSNPIFVKVNPPVRINEIATNGNTQFNGLDWVELYNTSDKPVTLTGYTLDDTNSSGKGESAQLDSITIPAKGYKVLIETSHFSFGLGKSGDQVTLKRNGYLVDQIIYSPNIADKTLGRIEDGEGETNVTYDGTNIGGWQIYEAADATIGTSNNTFTFIYTSDQHYGITRKSFRGAGNVDATVVNAALVSQINKLNDINLPDDDGVNSSKQIGINFIIQTGDISNRKDSENTPLAAVTMQQFDNDYTNSITLQNIYGEKPALYINPGNHDVSNAIGHKKIKAEDKDATTMATIYNRMLEPTVPRTKDTYNYATDKINYIRNIGRIQFLFVNMWPDENEREWISANMSSDQPAFIFTHDQPDVEAKHLTDSSWVSGEPIFSNSFENLVDQKASQNSPSGSTATEQQQFANFIKANPNIKAYFHGNDNHNEFYTYQGPSKDINLPTFRVDSPMKGNISGSDESKLSFQIVTVNKNNKQMTVRECLWNTTKSAGSPIVFGQSKTINY